jgi:hypothetical protein
MATTAPIRSAASPVTESGTAMPTRDAAIVSFVFVLVGVLAGVLIDLGDGFTPRVETLDALAGLSIGAFIVDRLLTFVPPVGAADDPKQRMTDLTVLRLGYGALLGAIFVMLTDLRAVHALTPTSSTTISAGIDRGIAVLAIAGGVAGLARLLSAINPQPATDGNKEPTEAVNDDSGNLDAIPPPSSGARLVGLAAVGIGAAVALFAVGDKNGVDLLGPDKQADGTVALIVRFGLVFLAAGIVQQLAEFAGRLGGFPKNNKPLLLGGLAVVLGVLAARVFDLFLLHNIGFFGATGQPLNVALSQSSDLERWADTFFTGLVIAAGAKPVHDIASRLRKAKKSPELV